MRNIPAHAGKTSINLRSPRQLKEHPRARGENSLVILRANMWGGTSPRTRGKLLHWGYRGWGLGNIPAHAGKTSKFPAPRGV